MEDKLGIPIGGKTDMTSTLERLKYFGNYAEYPEKAPFVPH